MTPPNLVYLSDYRHPEGDIVYWHEYVDLWTAVLRVSFMDYWRGIREGEHLKPSNLTTHPTRHAARKYRNWIDARDWLLSDSTEPRSFLWIVGILKLDPVGLRARMDKPPVIDDQPNEEEQL